MGERTGTGEVLVTAASRHGATAEIARVVGEVLTARGVPVEMRHPDEVDRVDTYRACVIGSAIYGGRWHKDGTRLVLRHAEALRARPVWLFSSGPVGDPAKPDSDPADLAVLGEVVTPREHRVFAGKLDKSGLGFMERQAVRVVRAPYGDFRDWEAVRSWAAAIADELGSDPAAAGGE